MSVKSKIVKKLGQAWQAAKTNNITPSLSNLKNNFKYEMKYNSSTGKTAGDLTKGWLPKPTATTGAKLIGKAIAKSALPLAAGKAAYDIGKAWYGTNKEINKNVKESSARSDELIAAIKRQRKPKK
jgi:hypothetical protein